MYEIVSDSDTGEEIKKGGIEENHFPTCGRNEHGRKVFNQPDKVQRYQKI